MSAGGAFGGARGNVPKPPEKGVFPLDHLGECKDLKEAYTACLRASASDADSCVASARAYLACRMERGLMAAQSLDELGVEASGAVKSEVKGEGTRSQARTKAGFVAGIRPTRQQE